MATTTTAATMYKVGKPYNVRTNTAQHNARTWQAVTDTLQANGGKATLAQLQAAVEPYNHAPFIGYCQRRGWLVATK